MYQLTWKNKKLVCWSRGGYSTEWLCHRWSNCCRYDYCL